MCCSELQPPRSLLDSPHWLLNTVCCSELKRGREGGREGGRERKREGGREGGREPVHIPDPPRRYRDRARLLVESSTNRCSGPFRS